MDISYSDNQGLAQDLEKADLSDGQLLFPGAAADVLYSSAKLVKKVLRLSPAYFNNSAMEKGEDILSKYRKAFGERTLAWSQLVHPNIALLSEPSQATLSFYQEFCEQGDLCNYVEHGAGSQFICYSIIEGILGGLTYLHNHVPVIAHGNIKASKIFVTSDGTVKIGEFGLAGSMTQFSHLVPAVSFNGLVRWASPERLELEIDGHEEAASTKSDVWSFGCTLFEILARRLPYSKHKYDPKVIQRIMAGEPPGDLEQVTLPSQHVLDSGAETHSRCTNFVRALILKCWVKHLYRATSKELLEQVTHKLLHHTSEHSGNQTTTVSRHGDTASSVAVEPYKASKEFVALFMHPVSILRNNRIVKSLLDKNATLAGERSRERGRRGGVPIYQGQSGSHGGVFGVGPETIYSRLNTHANDNLVASFKHLAVKESKLSLRPDFGKIGQDIRLRANYFPVNYGKVTIYDYEISIEPETGIKQIMKRVLQIFMSSPEFAPYAASASHDNMRRLVSLKEIPVTGAIKVFSVAVTYFEEDKDGPTETSENYRVALKLIRQHDTSEMTKYLGGTVGYGTFNPQPILSAFNILLAKYPSQHGVMVGRNKWFFPTPGQAADLGGGLEAYRGFYGSVRPSFQQLMVNLNVATTAFYRPGNLADLFIQFGPSGASRLAAFVYNLRIEMTHTGRKMRKVIKGIKLKDTASNYMFVCDEYGEKKISVEEYFKRKYNIALRYPKMPLVDINGNKECPILVPAEICTILPNQPFRGKLSNEHTAAMILVACQPPNVNAQAIAGDGLNSLGLVGGNSPLAQMGLSVGSQMATVPGRVLPSPAVYYRNKTPANIRSASWNMRDVQFAVGARLDNWAVLFIQDGGRDDMLAATSRHIVSGFAAACGRSGMVVDRQAMLPPMVDVSLPPKDTESPLTRLNAIAAIRRGLLSIKPKPKIVLIVLSNQDKAIYNGIKHLCDIQLDVLTACVTAKTFKNGQVHYNANVALKFNAKLGGVNHTIKSDDQVMAWILQQPTMLVGSNITPPSPGSMPGTPSVAAVVGSTDSMFGQFPASLRLQEARKEIIMELKEMIAEILSAFKAKIKVLPQRVILFRGAVSESNFLTVLADELPKVQEAFSKFTTQDGKPYRPKLTILIAGKCHRTRFFPTRDEDADRGNCKPGTVIDRGVTSVYNFDFFVQVHRGLQGTTRPAHYTVLHDDNSFTADRLQGLVHNMTYLFAHDTKAISLVPPVYYANLASKRGRCYLAQLLNTFDGATSILRESSTEDQVIAEARRLWERGPTGPGVGQRMFYI